MTKKNGKAQVPSAAPREKYSEFEKLFRRGALSPNQDGNHRLYVVGLAYRYVMECAESLGSIAAIDYTRPMVDNSAYTFADDFYEKMKNRDSAIKKAGFWRKILGPLCPYLDAVILSNMDTEKAALHVLCDGRKLAIVRLLERVRSALDVLEQWAPR